MTIDYGFGCDDQDHLLYPDDLCGERFPDSRPDGGQHCPSCNCFRNAPENDIYCHETKGHDGPHGAQASLHGRDYGWSRDGSSFWVSGRFVALESVGTGS